MNDRKPLIALLLIFAIAFFPAVYLRYTAKNQPAASADSTTIKMNGQSTQSTATTPTLTTGSASTASTATATNSATIPEANVQRAVLSTATAPIAMDTVIVRSKIYRYAIATNGSVVSSRILHYRSLNLTEPADTVELVPADAPLLGLSILRGGDTLRLGNFTMKVSADSIDASNGPATLTMSGTSGEFGIELTWDFVPDDYHFDVRGKLTGLHSVGATLLIDMGNGFRDVEANVPENHRESGIVTMLNKSELTKYMSLKPRIVKEMSGPFAWVAIKSKYFVAGLFAADSTITDAGKGRVAGLRVFPADTNSQPIRAQVAAAITVPPQGDFNYRIYLGPMEYSRLTAMGGDFDDVNPYGIWGLRTVIRPFAIAIRALFLGMHHTFGLGFGWVIIIFGILVRVLLWPLNSKAMRSMMAMQAIQPEMQEIQAKYKEDQPRLQQEMMKLYKDNKVNPLGGCWPMLLPYPLLVGVFFVLQNTIELRGVHFLWFEDLSRKDPYYIVPVLMAISMFVLTKIGQKGMPPNPQAKMMMYMMPVVFLFMFMGLASGLNMYYFVQNMASLPQQLMISNERQKLMALRTGTSSTGNKVEVKRK